MAVTESEKFCFFIQSSRYTKMEKADILEMAVKHLKALRETVNSKSTDALYDRLFLNFFQFPTFT